MNPVVACMCVRIIMCVVCVSGHEGGVGGGREWEYAHVWSMNAYVYAHMHCV